MSTHSLTDFAIADSVTKDFPAILKSFDQILSVLKHFRHYSGVAFVVTAIEDSKFLMENQLRDAKSTRKNKARMLNE